MGIFNPGGTYNENDSGVISGESGTDDGPSEGRDTHELSEFFDEEQVEVINEIRRRNGSDKGESGERKLEERKEAQRKEDQEKIKRLQKEIAGSGDSNEPGNIHKLSDIFGEE